MAQNNNPDAHMILVEEALDIIMGHVAETPVEEVVSWRAVGRPLARDVATDIDLAPFANSAMDGYAVHARDLAEADDGHPVANTVSVYHFS